MRISCEGRRCSLDRFGLMQRPKSTETEAKRSGGEARAVGGLREEEDGAREKKEESRGMPIYKENVNRWARKSRDGQIMVIQLHRRLDSRKTLKGKIRWEMMS